MSRKAVGLCLKLDVTRFGCQNACASQVQVADCTGLQRIFSEDACARLAGGSSWNYFHIYSCDRTARLLTVLARPNTPEKILRGRGAGTNEELAALTAFDGRPKQLTRWKCQN